MQKYIEDQQIHFYTNDKGERTVELHMDPIYSYDENDGARILPKRFVHRSLGMIRRKLPIRQDILLIPFVLMVLQVKLGIR